MTRLSFYLRAFPVMTRRPFSILSILVPIALAGCGGMPVDDTVPMTLDAAPLAEIGEMYTMYIKTHQKPPARPADLEKYSPGFTLGSLAIQKKDVVVLWGKPLDKESGKGEVLAFETKALNDGGPVLMRDGATIKAFTAEDLKKVVPPEALAAPAKASRKG
jgi:hypothetical protein